MPSQTTLILTAAPDAAVDYDPCIAAQAGGVPLYQKINAHECMIQSHATNVFKLIFHIQNVQSEYTFWLTELAAGMAPFIVVLFRHYR